MTHLVWVDLIKYTLIAAMNVTHNGTWSMWVKQYGEGSLHMHIHAIDEA